MMLQVMAAAQGGANLSAAKVAKGIWLREGWRGFCAGMTARIMSIAPESAIVWLLYESMKKFI